MLKRPVCFFAVFLRQALAWHPDQTSSPARSLPLGRAIFGALSVFVCGAAQADILYGVNHTHWAINRFSVDGNPGVDGVDPYQRGGGGGGYFLPARWVPGMTALVEWEAGLAYSDDFPGFADEAKYDAWLKRVDVHTRRHSGVVLVPDYTGQNVCGLTIHFLPCDELLATTSCYAYGSPEYPIKTPLRLPEPTSCPK